VPASSRRAFRSWLRFVKLLKRMGPSLDHQSVEGSFTSAALLNGMPRRARGMWAHVRLAMLCAALVWSSGCGGKTPPPRGVIEADVAGWQFRRFQTVLDVEVWVPENPAVAHTASYVEASAAHRLELESTDVVSVFVTQFEREEGVEEAVLTLARRLARESGYRVEGVRAARGGAFSVGGRGEAWMLWSSGEYVVKVGGRGRDSVPSEVVDAYARHYPSTLEANAL
jgi:hypothetical protein